MTELILTKKNYVKTANLHVFTNDNTGELHTVECTDEEYASLSDAKNNPVLDGYTWKYSLGGALKADTPTGLLSEGEYIEKDNVAYVKSNELPNGGKKVLVEDIQDSKLTI